MILVITSEIVFLGLSNFSQMRSINIENDFCCLDERGSPLPLACYIYLFETVASFFRRSGAAPVSQV